MARLLTLGVQGFPNALRFDLGAAEIAKTSQEVMEAYKKVQIPPSKSPTIDEASHESLASRVMGVW